MVFKNQEQKLHFIDSKNKGDGASARPRFQVLGGRVKPNPNYDSNTML
jgi:hypothetical protein